MADEPIRITETERPLRSSRPSHPQAEIWQLIRTHARAMRAEQEQAGIRIAAEHDRLRSLLVDLAGAQHQLRQFAATTQPRLVAAGSAQSADVVAGIARRFDLALEAVGAELICPDGEALTPELAQRVEVKASLPTPDVDRPTVRHTMEPGVMLHGELVQPAQISLSVPVPDGESPDHRQEDNPR